MSGTTADERHNLETLKMRLNCFDEALTVVEDKMTASLQSTAQLKDAIAQLQQGAIDSCKYTVEVKMDAAFYFGAFALLVAFATVVITYLYLI